MLCRFLLFPFALSFLSLSCRTQSGDQSTNEAANLNSGEGRRCLERRWPGADASGAPKGTFIIQRTKDFNSVNDIEEVLSERLIVPRPNYCLCRPQLLRTIRDVYGVTQVTEERNCVITKRIQNNVGDSDAVQWTSTGPSNFYSCTVDFCARGIEHVRGVREACADMVDICGNVTRGTPIDFGAGASAPAREPSSRPALP